MPALTIEDRAEAGRLLPERALAFFERLRSTADLAPPAPCRADAENAPQSDSPAFATRGGVPAGS